MLKKILVVGIIILFICSSLASGISNFTKDYGQMDIEIDNNKSVEKATVTCQTFGVSKGTSIQSELSGIKARELLDKINELSVVTSTSAETGQLQEEILSLAKEYDLISEDISLEDLKPGFAKSLNHNNGLSGVNGNTGTAFLCNFATTGEGSQFPVIILPRLIPIIQLPIPRLFLRWSSPDGITSTGSYLTNTGYIAAGEQTGIALGFWGIGFSIFLPPIQAYGFFGYALYSRCTAEEMEPWPPNNAPIISDESPTSGEWDVSVSQTELSFRIEDPDGDKMDYIVTTDPDIGSGSGDNKNDGVYTVPISNLEHTTSYVWTVEVTDGVDTVNSEFSFMTEELPFNPFEDGWHYRKKITVDHTKVDENLENFPILVSTIDPDFKDKAQNDGDDILFMDDVGVANKMYHELEGYDNDSGEMIAWVNVDEISANEDTVFYMYYGNPNSDNQQLPEWVWSNQFHAVWHLNEDPTETIHDSTMYDNYGTSHGSMTISDLTDGKTGKCIEFDGEDDYIAVLDSNTLKPTDVTLTAWFKTLEENVPQNGYIVSKSSGDTWGNADGHSYGFCYTKDNYVDARFERDQTKVQQEHAGCYFTTNNEWHHLTLTFDENSNIACFYVNGLINGTVSSCHDSVLWYPDAWDFLMGASRQREGSSHNPNTFFKCRIDEVRVLNIAVNGSWVSTEYNNQNNPSSFLSFGPEET